MPHPKLVSFRKVVQQSFHLFQPAQHNPTPTLPLFCFIYLPQHIYPNQPPPQPSVPSLLLHINSNLGPSIRNLDTQLLRLCQNLHPLPGRHRVRDLGRVGPVVHEQHVDVVDVVHEEGFVAGGHHVAGFLVRAVADLLRERERGQREVVET